jgi:hypothetical protein
VRFNWCFQPPFLIFRKGGIEEDDAQEYLNILGRGQEEGAAANAAERSEDLIVLPR